MGMATAIKTAIMNMAVAVTVTVVNVTTIKIIIMRMMFTMMAG
jgi:hypothetical protein